MGVLRLTRRQDETVDEWNRRVEEYWRIVQADFDRLKELRRAYRDNVRIPR